MLRDLLGRKMLLREIAILDGENKYELQIDQKFASTTYLIEVLKSNGSERAVKMVVKE